MSTTLTKFGQCFFRCYNKQFQALTGQC